MNISVLSLVGNPTKKEEDEYRKTCYSHVRFTTKIVIFSCDLVIININMKAKRLGHKL